MEPATNTSGKRARYCRLALQAVVSLVLIGWIASRFDLAKASEVIGQVRPDYAAAGFVAAVCMTLLLGLRFACVLRKGGLDLPLVQAIGITWIGQFWNFFLPGSTGGDLYRLNAMWSAHPKRKGDAAVAVFADRLIATALLAVLAALGMFMLPLATVLGRWIGDQRFAVKGAALLVLVLGILGATMLAIRPVRIRLRDFAARGYSHLIAGRVFLAPDRRLAIILALGIAGHLANFFVFYSYARAVGLEVRYSEVCLMLPIVLLLLILPISINGHGVREILVVILLTAIGVTSAAGVPLLDRVIALSVVGVSSDFVIGLTGGLAFVFSRWAASRRVPLQEVIASSHDARSS